MQAKGLPPEEYRLYGDDAVNVMEACATEDASKKKDMKSKGKG